VRLLERSNTWNRQRRERAIGPVLELDEEQKKKEKKLSLLFVDQKLHASSVLHAHGGCAFRGVSVIPDRQARKHIILNGHEAVKSGNSFIKFQGYLLHLKNAAF
jgi:hypothetical protein